MPRRICQQIGKRGSPPIQEQAGSDASRQMCKDRLRVVSGGYHCAHVLHHRLNLAGTLRASAQIFNDAADIEAFLAALREL